MALPVTPAIVAVVVGSLSPAVTVAFVVPAVAIVVQPLAATRIVFLAVLVAGVGRLVQEDIIRCGIEGR
jgi:hypothetical protein